MYNTTVNYISAKAFLKVQKPDFSTIENHDFMELFNKGITFYQVNFRYRYCDFRSDKQYRFNVTSKQVADAMEAVIKVYNQQLKDAQEVALKEYAEEYNQKVASGQWKWNEHDFSERDYKSFASVGHDIGFCDIMVHERNKVREEQEEQEAYEQLSEEEKKELKEDANKPFGGAFSSWEEYYRYRGL